ncbi:MAG: hypothetical protein M3067_14725 [Chloroflexota bacterium]|nr:hypothetical protein [Chloroflexota bacterium]
MTKGLRITTLRAFNAVGFGVLVALSVAGPVSAKLTPYFTVEVSPPQPVVGEAIVVVVRTWADGAHTVPAGFGTSAALNSAALDGLLVLRPTTGDAPDIAIRLKYQALDEFRATVVAPTAGDWKLVAFPDRTGWGSPEVPPGYPDTIALTVRAPNGGVLTSAAIIGLTAVIGIVSAAAWLARRARRGRLVSVLHSSDIG